MASLVVTASGPAEARWHERIASLPTWEVPTDRHVVVVGAHPDDETLGLGGTLQLLAARACRLDLVTITDGEASHVGIPDLAGRRRGELRAALTRLGVDAATTLHHLEVPDGDVADHEADVADRIAQLTTTDSLVLAPCTDDGHTDHDAAGRAAIRAATLAGAEVRSVPRLGVALARSGVDDVARRRPPGPAPRGRRRAEARRGGRVRQPGLGRPRGPDRPPARAGTVVARRRGGGATVRVNPDDFEHLYRGAADGDPWAFATSPYEQRRYEVTMACLDRPRYGRAFEPGCATGELTRRLATRCDEVLAIDPSPTALATARDRLADVAGVTLALGTIPETWPDTPVDLLVLSEIGYYFDRDDLADLAERSVANVAPGGQLLAVHWRGHSDDHLLHGDTVHEVLERAIGPTPSLHHEEPGFRVTRWDLP